MTQSSPAAATNTADVDRYVHLLNDADDRVRAESVLQLGRMHAQSAVDAVTATLAGDKSPAVRESAARALGLMGSSRALPALQRSAQSDADRDVRHSAEFAIDIIQSQNGHY